MGALPAITQFGLAIGLFTVVPLYDLFERRRMIVATLLLLAAAAAAHSLATDLPLLWATRSEEHTSELQSLMRISYAVFCLKKKNKQNKSKTQDSHYIKTKYHHNQNEQ